jgi:ribonuclease E
MADGATGQPVEVPADTPGSSTAASQQAAPDSKDRTDGSPAASGSTPATAAGGVDAEFTSGPRGEQPGGDGTNRRRRGSRGGRGRGRSGTGAVHASDDGVETPGSTPVVAAVPPGGGVAAGGAVSAAPAPGASPVPPRPVTERPKIGDSRPARVPVGDAGEDAPSGTATAGRSQSRPGGGTRPRQRNGAGKGSGARGAESGGGTPRSGTAAKAEGRRGGRERRGKAVGRYMICVHVRPDMTQIALLEGRTLVEHYVSRASDDATQIDGNIYRGRVQNVLPGMEAAFIDIGTPKNAVLYHGDVRYDVDDVESGAKSGQPRIEQLLRPGQTILCQVTKNPIGAKGARLTQEVSLPGRFVVLVPNSTAYGISKRLEDAERKRLRRIVDAVRPEGHGLIVRTAAAGASEEELAHDVGRLLEQWETIAGAATKGQGPALLYREPAIAVRVIREELNREYRAVVIDDPALYEQVRDYVGAVNPELADRVEYFDPEAESLPVFERYHVHEQLHKALDRKVFLPSGGSLVIDRTEALTVIDVNTGKNVGTTNLEETVYRNNLEAAEEVARQLRLRDIGGIIVIDFIDMEIRENRDKVAAALRNALARDKTRTQVFDISELGLVEMTRKRISEGLLETLSTECAVCAGRGVTLDDSVLR